MIPTPRRPPAEYQRMLVTFVDILGFKNLVEAGTAAECLDVLESKRTLSLKRWIPDYDEMSNAQTFSFSDLIVNVIPLNTVNPLHAFFDQLCTLGFRQFLLASRKVFVRGGITVGDIYADGNAIFGPALIRAYELESQTAKWPIIAIDPALIQTIESETPRYLALRKEQDGASGPALGQLFLAFLSSLVNKTSEGTHFVDYIGCLAYEDSTTGDLDRHLANHRESVLDAFQKHPHYKYEFIARYHDAKCAKYFPDRRDLRIDRALSPTP